MVARSRGLGGESTRQLTSTCCQRFGHWGRRRRRSLAYATTCGGKKRRDHDSASLLELAAVQTLGPERMGGRGSHPTLEGDAYAGPLHSPGPLSCSCRRCKGVHPVQNPAGRGPSLAPALRPAPRCLTYASPLPSAAPRSACWGMVVRCSELVVGVVLQAAAAVVAAAANVGAIGVEDAAITPSLPPTVTGRNAAPIARTHCLGSPLSGPPLLERMAARGSHPTHAGNASIWSLHRPGPLSCSRGLNHVRKLAKLPPPPRAPARRPTPTPPPARMVADLPQRLAAQIGAW
jgi:hypothetical protein